MATGSLAFIADYDDDDDDDTEPDDETNDDWNIKGTHLRGRFTISQDGQCPRCGTSNVVFVVLDELFPMGDMPDILVTLIAKGKAVLWSSQSKKGCKAPPTFLCRGFCPPDPLGAGFNVNWGNVSLQELFFSSKQDINQIEDNNQKGRSNEEGEENSSDEDDDIDEEELIKQMLEKEAQKNQDNELDTDDNQLDTNKHVNNEQQNKKETITSTGSSHSIPEHLKTTRTIYSTTVSTENETTTSSSTSPVTSTDISHEKNSVYPVSSDGFCPHCYSKNVKYIIVFAEGMKDSDLPYTLRELLKRDQAFKMAKGPNEPPSFQCQVCLYGFNLDWSATNLELVFGIAKGGATSKPSNASTTPSMSPSAVPPRGPPLFPPPGVPPPRMGVHPGMPPPGISSPRPPPALYLPGMIPPRVPPPRMPPRVLPVVPPPRMPPRVLPVVPPPRMPPPDIPQPQPGMPPPGMSPPGIPPPRVPSHTPYPGPHRGLPPGLPPPIYGPQREYPPRIPPYRHPPSGTPPPFSGVPSPRYPPYPYYRHPEPPPRYPAYGYHDPRHPPGMTSHPYGQHPYPPAFPQHCPASSVPPPPGTQPTGIYKQATYDNKDTSVASHVATCVVTTITTSVVTSVSKETSCVDGDQSLQDKKKLDELLNQIDKNRGVIPGADVEMISEEGHHLWSGDLGQAYDDDDLPPGDDVMTYTMDQVGVENLEEESVTFEYTAIVDKESDFNKDEGLTSRQNVTESDSEQNDNKDAENIENNSTHENDKSTCYPDNDTESANGQIPITRRGRKRKAAAPKTLENSKIDDEEAKQQKVENSLELALESDTKKTIRRGRRVRRPRGGKTVSTRKGHELESPSSDVEASGISPTNEIEAESIMINNTKDETTAHTVMSPLSSVEQEDNEPTQTEDVKTDVSAGEQDDSVPNSTPRQRRPLQKSSIGKDKYISIGEFQTASNEKKEHDEEPEQPSKREQTRRSKKSLSESDEGQSGAEKVLPTEKSLVETTSNEDMELDQEPETKQRDQKSSSETDMVSETLHPQEKIGTLKDPGEELTVSENQQMGYKTERIELSKKEAITTVSRRPSGRTFVKVLQDDKQLEEKPFQPSCKENSVENNTEKPKRGRSQKEAAIKARAINDHHHLSESDTANTELSNEQTSTDAAGRRRGRPSEGLILNITNDDQTAESKLKKAMQPSESVVKRRGRPANKGNVNKTYVTTDKLLSEADGNSTEPGIETHGSGKRKGQDMKVLTSPTINEPDDKNIPKEEEEDTTLQTNRSTRGATKNPSKAPSTISKRQIRGRKLSSVDNYEVSTATSDGNVVMHTRRSLSNPSDENSLEDSEHSSETESNKTSKATTRGRSLRRRK